MGTTKLNLRHFFTMMLVCALVAFPAFGAKFDVSGNAFTITPQDLSFGYKLDVEGPGDFTDTVEFAAGEFISWSGAGDDGVYSFELTPVAAQRERGKDAPAQAPEKISGVVTMIGGNFADPRRPEKLEKDVVHLDDTIIQFSLCVGQDCVNGESFGFDTVRLKENNLRIHFDDTSTSASFPSNDWRIIINDSSNGGGNYFAIEDSSAGRQVFRVDAGAPANSIRVDAQGDLGIGESSPVVEIHVQDGDSPTLRLEQDGSSGFTPQTFDMVANEANFFIRDVTNGSQLPFRIKPGADTDALYINSDNNIGFGTSSPGSELHIRRVDTGGTFIKVENANATARNTSVQLTNALGDWALRNNTNGQLAIVDVNAGTNVIVFAGQLASPPVVGAAIGTMYVDNSPLPGALCFYDGSSWNVAAGAGNCS